jgi:hypothetical protein
VEWDWVVISGLATAAGTFVLALATFWSVRSANRAARVAEESLLASVRPLLMPSRLADTPLKVNFADNHFVRVDGGAGTAELVADAIYLTLSVRNAGNGIAILHGWRVAPSSDAMARSDAPKLDSFRRLTRDLYIAAGDHGFWQGAIRDRNDADWDVAASAITARERLVIDVLYGDHQGGQRVISRFILLPREDDQWLASVARHWNVDRPDPR